MFQLYYFVGTFFAIYKLYLNCFRKRKDEHTNENAELHRSKAVPKWIDKWTNTKYTGIPQDGP